MILPDNDGPGRKYARDVADILGALDPPAQAQVVELPGLAEGGDIADWAEARAGASPGELRAELDGLLAAAPPPDPPPGPAAPIEASEERPWPEPLDAAASSGPLGEYARLTAPNTEADPAAVLAQSLLLFGAAAGRSAHSAVGSARHHANEFLVVVGDTSGGRKGTSSAEARAAFAGVDDAFLAGRVATGLSSGEGPIQFVRDPAEKREAVQEKGEVVRHETAVADEGEPDKRALFLEPEFVGVPKQSERAGNTPSVALRQAWESGDLFGESTGDSVADDILRLLRQSPGGVARSDISNFFGRNLPSARLSTALDSLLKRGQVRSEMRAGAAGQPAEVWHAAGGGR